MRLELIWAGKALVWTGKALWAIVKASYACCVFVINHLRIPGTLRLPGSAGRSQVLCPGDPPTRALGLADALDYRGTATQSELGSLNQEGVPLGRLMHPSGRTQGRLHLPLAMLRRGCAIIGPTGAGKTAGLVIPWIKALLEQRTSVVTCDVKGDLFDSLQSAARQIGVRVWYWNISDPARSMAWNWFDAINDQRDVEAATLSIIGKPNPRDSQPFFYQRDYRWLRALIGITKQAYKHTAKPHYLYLLAGDQQALKTLFQKSPSIQHLSSELSDLLQLSPDEHSRAVSGLLNALHLFNTPAIRHVTERSDFNLDELHKMPTLLIIGAALADGRASEVMSGMFINLLNSLIYRRLAGQQAADAPLYMILDEAARLKDRVNYEELLSIVRSANVGVCLASQDVSQFGDTREQTAILTNCLTFVALRGSSAETVKYLASRLGQRQQEEVIASKSREALDLLSAHSKSRKVAMVPVLGEREIMHPPGSPYAAVVHASPASSKPFLVDLKITD